MTHGVIGNTSDFGSEESGFEPLWVNMRPAEMPASVFLPVEVLFLIDPHIVDVMELREDRC